MFDAFAAFLISQARAFRVLLKCLGLDLVLSVLARSGTPGRCLVAGPTTTADQLWLILLHYAFNSSNLNLI